MLTKIDHINLAPVLKVP